MIYTEDNIWENRKDIFAKVFNENDPEKFIKLISSEIDQLENKIHHYNLFENTDGFIGNINEGNDKFTLDYIKERWIHIESNKEYIRVNYKFNYYFAYNSNNDIDVYYKNNNLLLSNVTNNFELTTNFLLYLPDKKVIIDGKIIDIEYDDYLLYNNDPEWVKKCISYNKTFMFYVNNENNRRDYTLLLNSRFHTIKDIDHLVPINKLFVIHKNGLHGLYNPYQSITINPKYKKITVVGNFYMLHTEDHFDIANSSLDFIDSPLHLSNIRYYNANVPHKDYYIGQTFLGKYALFDEAHNQITNYTNYKNIEFLNTEDTSRYFILSSDAGKKIIYDNYTHYNVTDLLDKDFTEMKTFFLNDKLYVYDDNYIYSLNDHKYIASNGDYYLQYFTNSDKKIKCIIFFKESQDSISIVKHNGTYTENEIYSIELNQILEKGFFKLGSKMIAYIKNKNTTKYIDLNNSKELSFNNLYSLSKFK